MYAQLVSTAVRACQTCRRRRRCRRCRRPSLHGRAGKTGDDLDRGSVTRPTGNAHTHAHSPVARLTWARIPCAHSPVRPSSTLARTRSELIKNGVIPQDSGSSDATRLITQRQCGVNTTHTLTHPQRPICIRSLISRMERFGGRLVPVSCLSRIEHLDGISCVLSEVNFTLIDLIDLFRLCKVLRSPHTSHKSRTNKTATTSRTNAGV